MRIPVAPAAAALLALAACGPPCEAIEAEWRELVARDAAAVAPHAEVSIAFAYANQIIAQGMSEPLRTPLVPEDYGGLAEFLRAPELVVRRATLRPSETGRVTVDLELDVRDEEGELFALEARVLAEPRLVRESGRVALEVGIGARAVEEIRPHPSPRVIARLREVLLSRAPSVMQRLPPPVFEEMVRKLVAHLGREAYTVLRDRLLVRLGELTALRVEVPDIPVEHLEIAPSADGQRLELAVYTTLPVRFGLGPGATPTSGAPVAVRLAGSTVAELANWGMAVGHLPQRYQRGLKPDPRGDFQPVFTWIEGTQRPLWIHNFRVEGGCEHHVVSVSPVIGVEGDDLVVRIVNSKLESTRGPLFITVAARLKELITSSVGKSKRAAASIRIRVGERELAARVKSASIAEDEVAFGLELRIDSQPPRAVSRASF